MTTENLDGIYRRKGGFKDETQFLAVIEGKCYIVKNAFGYSKEVCQRYVDKGDWEKFNFPNNDSVVEGLIKENETLKYVNKNLSHEVQRLTPYFAAIDNELVSAHILNYENNKSAFKAMHDIICWNVEVALDPTVSKEARELHERIIELEETVEGLHEIIEFILRAGTHERRF